MNGQELAECAFSDPNHGVEEKEFTVSFVKKDDVASFSTSIKGTMRQALRHSDIDINKIQVYYEDDDSYENMSLEEFEGEGKIAGVKGTCPIGLIKLGKSPRKSGGYTTIISSQEEFSMND